MHSAQVIALIAVLVGIVGAFLIGRFGPKGFWPLVGFLFADVFLGVALVIAVFHLFSVCHELLNLCSQVDDQSTWAVLYPLIFIPAYWISTVIAKVTRPVGRDGGVPADWPEM